MFGVESCSHDDKHEYPYTVVVSHLHEYPLETLSIALGSRCVRIASGRTLAYP